jgi:tRNA(Ile)-lysidine synthase
LLDYRDLDSQLIEFLDASHWYVGFSGGVDSTVLLHLLQRWCTGRDTTPALGAIHVNHGLQAAADDWQLHCEVVCRALGIECVSVAVDVAADGTGEVAARDARYRVFSGQLPAGAVLFLAHHLDDQVETFFLRLLRGAGVEGLAAMPRRRALGAGELARPLLACSRAELEEYAAHHGLAHIEDPSNSDTALDRNFLRQRVLPLIATRWPAYRQSVSRASAHLGGAARLLAEVPATVHSVMGDPGLPLDALIGESADVAANRLRGWLRDRACRSPGHVALVEFLRQLREAKGDARPRLDCGHYALQRHRAAVYLLPEFGQTPPSESMDLAPGSPVSVPGLGALSLVAVRDEGLRLAAGEQLTLRWRQGGERCRPRGRGGSVSLKALLQELGVPPWWRDRVPLVYLGDELLAVGDLVRCESGRWIIAEQGAEQPWQVVWQRPSGASCD